MTCQLAMGLSSDCVRLFIDGQSGGRTRQIGVVSTLASTLSGSWVVCGYARGHGPPPEPPGGGPEWDRELVGK